MNGTISTFRLVEKGVTRGRIRPGPVGDARNWALSRGVALSIAGGIWRLTDERHRPRLDRLRGERG
ncbi:MAG TPA: hypothetical protein VMW31_00155 [Devosiaceae bacterium]|nr:hypothetical protein [Devosiaceae bacterium]